MALDRAIAQAKERAEARCAGCQMDKRLNFGKLQLPPRQRYPDHTCHGDLAAVRVCMLAAVYRAVDIAEDDILGPQDAADGVVAEIRELLLEGAKE